MKKGKRTAIFFLGFLSVTSSLAEYRVYQYYVRSAVTSPRDANSYMVTSTLHPVAYQAYHGGVQSLRVDLLHSWMCFGSTSRRPVCPSPLEELQKKLNSENQDQGRDLAGEETP